MSIFLSRLNYTKIAFMLLEAKLLLDEVATEVFSIRGAYREDMEGYGRIWENMGEYGRLWEVMGGYGGIWERRRWFVRNE